MQGIWDITNLTPLERPAQFKSLLISRADADRFEASIDALKGDLRPSQAFDEDRRMEPIHGELRSSQIFDPPDGLIPGNARFKERATQIRAQAVSGADGPEQRPAQERCLLSPAAAAPMQANATGNLHQIVQTHSTIVIHSEWNHEARVIRMNAKHGPPTVTSWLGDSIGWWEDRTLVVETKYFAPNSGTRAAPLVLFFVSPQTVVTERFTLISNQELRYVFTVLDPAYYTQSWTGETHFRRSADRVFEFACHEGNYALANVLLSARVRDAKRD
jgi:hypothetical protein